MFFGTFNVTRLMLVRDPIKNDSPLKNLRKLDIKEITEDINIESRLWHTIDIIKNFLIIPTSTILIDIGIFTLIIPSLRGFIIFPDNLLIPIVDILIGVSTIGYLGKIKKENKTPLSK